MVNIKAAFNWLASCGGCEEAIVDLHEELLNVVEAVDIVYWPCALDFKKEDVERMTDGEIDVSFINGAVRTSDEEETAVLLRRKSKYVIAFGSCAHLGGIPGMGNFFSAKEILRNSYLESPSLNQNEMTPQVETRQPEGIVTLPRFCDSVRTLDQTIPVDYYLPGCPPPTRLIKEALRALLGGELPARGSVLAPDIAQCHECPRKETKPDEFHITEWKRPHEAVIDPKRCILAQGFLCLGPVTRCGCDSPCIKANMPCTGCIGPISQIKDYGAKAVATIASLFDSREEHEIEATLDQIIDPAGTVYRYCLPASQLFQRLPGENKRHNEVCA